MSFVSLFLELLYAEMRRSLGFLGDLSSIFGLLVSFAGFALTLFGLHRVKLETERTRREAEEKIENIGSRLFVSKVQLTVQQLQKMSDACRERQWSRAIDRYEEASDYLAQLIDEPKIGVDDKKRVSNYIDDLILIKQKVQTLNNRKRPDEEALSLINKLDQILIHFRRLRSSAHPMDLQFPRVRRGSQ
jgi:hypothetical protein